MKRFSVLCLFLLSSFMTVQAQATQFVTLGKVEVDSNCCSCDDDCAGCCCCGCFGVGQVCEVKQAYNKNNGDTCESLGEVVRNLASYKHVESIPFTGDKFTRKNGIIYLKVNKSVYLNITKTQYEFLNKLRYDDNLYIQIKPTRTEAQCASFCGLGRTNFQVKYDLGKVYYADERFRAEWNTFNEFKDAYEKQALDQKTSGQY